MIKLSENGMANMLLKPVCQAVTVKQKFLEEINSVTVVNTI